MQGFACDGPRRIGLDRAVLTSIATDGSAAFLIIMAVTLGLILSRMQFERRLPTPA